MTRSEVRVPHRPPVVTQYSALYLEQSKRIYGRGRKQELPLICLSADYNDQHEYSHAIDDFDT